MRTFRLRTTAGALGLSLALLAGACSNGQPVTAGPAQEIPSDTLPSDGLATDDVPGDGTSANAAPSDSNSEDPVAPESIEEPQIENIDEIQEIEEIEEIVDPTPIEHSDPYCEAFLGLDGLGSVAPSTPAEAEAQVNAMLDQAGVLTALAPASLADGAKEMQGFLQLVADHATEQSWSIEWFDDLDEESLATWGVDLELVDRFLNDSDDRCRDSAGTLPVTDDVDAMPDDI